jgi:chemotaxis protein MotB
MPAGEQGYLVSVSDLMSVLIFLMMIILLIIVARAVFATVENEELKESKKSIEDQIEELTRENEALKSELEKENAELARLSALEEQYSEGIVQYAQYSRINEELLDSREARRLFIRHIESEMAKLGKPILIDPKEGVFRFQDDVLFDSGKYELKDRGKETLDALGGILAGILPCFVGERDSLMDAGCREPELFKPGRFDVILIEGHTDDVPISTPTIGDNLQLSTFRSWATYSHLMAAAPGLSALRNGSGEYLLGMSGYGENRPTKPNEGKEENRRLNRRVDFRIVLAAPEPEEDIPPPPELPSIPATSAHHDLSSMPDSTSPPAHPSRSGSGD